MQTQVQMLLGKLEHLPREILDEVVDFFDFLLCRKHENNPQDAFSAASEEALTRVWNNDEDAVYDAFLTLEV